MACSACCEGNLNAAKANVPVDVVFKNECGLVTGIQEPAAANQRGAAIERRSTGLQPREALQMRSLPAKSVVVAQPR